MKTLFFISILFISVSTIAQSEILPKDIQITTAVMAAPESERSAAKVYGYNQDGEFIVLREGSNSMICIADDPSVEGIKVACYSNKLEPFMARGRELSAQGMSEIDKRKTRQKEVESGQLKMPDSPSTLYVYWGEEDNYNKKTGELNDGKIRYVIYIPFATAESTGLALKPEAPGMPWLMDPGTHRAHIMITPAKNN